MVETLEHLIRQAAHHPRQPRLPLYRELLRSESFLLTVDEPMAEAEKKRVTRSAESFPIWADRDSELGGVWVPVFPAKDSVALYVEAKGLQAPSGQEFLWMGHDPASVFGLLRGIKCFSGIKLYLDEGAAVQLSWPEVKALSLGEIPGETPELYNLPVARLTLPAGMQVAYGKVEVGGAKGKGKLLYLPQAGHFKNEDLRKLVRLDLGGEDAAWMPCRHFLQVLRLLRGSEEGETSRYVEDLLCALVEFQMYGEAEALCEWLEKRGRQAYAWMALAVIYQKNGKLLDCADLCRQGLERYPAEKFFPLHGADALAALGQKAAALRMLEEALERFPRDVQLVQALEGLKNPQ